MPRTMQMHFCTCNYANPAPFRHLQQQLYFRSIGFSASFSNETLLSVRCRRSSTENKTNKELSITKFLSMECGLSRAQILILVRRDPTLFRIRSTERPQEAILLLKSYGFTDSQLKKIILQNPSFLTHRAHESLKPKLEIIRSLGFVGHDLGEAVSRGPRLLNVKDLDRNIGYLQMIFRSREGLIRAVKKDPNILALDPAKAEEQIQFLRMSGLPNEGIFRLISLCPSVLRNSMSSTKMKLEYVRNLGLEEASLAFIRAVAIINAYALDKLDEKMRALAGFGFEDEEIKKILRKCPNVLANSLEKIGRIVWYLVHEAELEARTLVKYPVILGLSLERRIIPRHQAFKYLTANQLFGRVVPTLPYFISLPEERFLKYYVHGKDHGPRLLEVYRASKQPTRDMQDSKPKIHNDANS